MSKMNAEVKIVLKHHKSRVYMGRKFAKGSMRQYGPVRTITLFRISRQTASTLDTLCWTRKGVKTSIMVNGYKVRLTGLSYSGKVDAKFEVIR